MESNTQVTQIAQSVQTAQTASYDLISKIFDNGIV
jgi:hypothetical protein